MLDGVYRQSTVSLRVCKTISTVFPMSKIDFLAKFKRSRGCSTLAIERQALPRILRQFEVHAERLACRHHKKAISPGFEAGDGTQPAAAELG
jgi:hypothetical protein